MNHYDLLGISRTATPAQIQQAYRQKMKAAHPDMTNGSDEHAKALNQAYAILSDSGKRAVYDARLRTEAPPPLPQTPYRGEYPSKRGVVIQEFISPVKPTDHDFAPKISPSVRWAIIAFLIAVLLTAILSYGALGSLSSQLPTPTPMNDLENYRSDLQISN